MSERGSRTDEYLDAMAALWSDPAPVSYQGRHVSFHNVDAHPRPGLEIYFMQGDPVAMDADKAKQYADLGLDRLLLYPAPLEDPDHVARFLEQHADLPLSG